mmetsp:Transcript_10397/g.20475  ORF Transcript_10397/g.20475 Transcript_10397/m.20475 type:complete len:164 (-) Transcript_10397:35-526(-)|eukprot:CAMPEP_0171525044 /NCGR_PEP_ID=MMETSP0959-20130129/9447_1 /TAXON_ID=87120 /ORGANISM="Aurantiochytrium limacinum, Strain ATCCMYA-1381" /LENGTH=163 /DNA_ID=CAMNT_0012065969 /DNA_START=321 /DNA_END=812 /DNA_ORIENTATION=-
MDRVEADSKKVVLLAAILGANEDVVDRDVDELDKEANHANHQESHCNRPSSGLELLAVRLSTFLDELFAILGKLHERLNDTLVQCVRAHCATLLSLLRANEAGNNNNEGLEQAQSLFAPKAPPTGAEETQRKLRRKPEEDETREAIAPDATEETETEAGRYTN